MTSGAAWRIVDVRTQLGIVLLLTVMTTTASAQSGFYVGGAAVADIRRFDTIELDPRLLASIADPLSRDGIAAGGGVRVGTYLHPLWSLELAVDAGSHNTNAFANPLASLPTRSSTLRLPELSNSTRFVTVSTVIGFHPAKTGRVRLGYLGGVAFVRGTYESTIPGFGGFGSATASFISTTGGFTWTSDAGFSGGAFTGITSRTPTFPTSQTTTLRRTDNSVGALMGFEAALDITHRLAIVPGIRSIVFSNAGQTVFLIRPEVGARWTF